MIPNYLNSFETLYLEDPREANRQWFNGASYGLFLHYGLYSILGRHEWVQYRENIYLDDYARLADQFTADQFDAAAIANFAKDCGMSYINITTRHHDSFCLWDTALTDFKSTNSPAGRDLIAELAEACEERGLGLFLYYSHGRDWKHPHAPNNDTWGGNARPKYDPPERAYAYGEKHNLELYLDFMKHQIGELLTMFPSVAGIWLDGIAVPMSGDVEAFKYAELYEYIRATSPHALIAYKQGLLGTEDFFTPEHYIPNSEDAPDKQGKLTSVQKKLEVCTTMIVDPVSWGYQANLEGRRRTVSEVHDLLKDVNRAGANLLLNSGPLPDGSLDQDDVAVLKEVGLSLRS
ncbi:MAG: alpha-L-fucosidase [Deinococcota bacterium]